jgi:hypothetical protein
MHHCIVQIGEGSSVQLKARPSLKQIQVNAPVPFPAPEMSNITSSAAMFAAELDPAAHCQEELAATQEWDFEIELAPDKRLSRL